jgi:uncharacterized protein (DUF1778 family)
MFRFRLSKTDRNQLDSAAAAAGMNTSDFVRTSSLVAAKPQEVQKC